jgi:hypothetical protein
MRRFWTVLAALATLSLTNCGYNAIQTTDEQVKAGWSEWSTSTSAAPTWCPISSIR